MQEFQTLIQAEELTDILRSHSQDIIILDCRYSLSDLHYGLKAYEQGHLPEAQFISMEKDLAGKPNGKNGRHPLPDSQTLAHTLGKLGVNNQSQVVVYDDNTAMSPRLWWLIRHLGHNHVAVLNGGLNRWRSLNLPMTTSIPEIKAKRFIAKIRADDYVDSSYILNELDNNSNLIIDARSPDRFRGENETLDPIGGHIPGAINHFFMNNLSPLGVFKSSGELLEIYNKLGASNPHKKIISQCGSGVTACHNLLAMTIAGIKNGVLYPGSWSEWCSDSSRPFIAQSS
ncbi:MAG TPA: sulfurtransferase [Alphaproteobacteria bacterium]|nr:sulfurtransferase [Alphaproteobacteria bacterium]